MSAEPDDHDRQTLERTAAAAQEGDWDRAFAMAESALADGLVHPLFHKLRGVKHERGGRLAEAVADFRAALAAAPGDYAILNALGLSLAKLGKTQEAIGALDEALVAEPGFAPAHFNRAWILENLGDVTGARAAYERCGRLDPTNAKPVAALAAITARAGDAKGARRQAERALGLDPREPAAMLALAMAEFQEGELEDAAAHTRQLLNAAPLPLHERGVALTLLGDVLDHQNRNVEAFEAYRGANSALHELYAQRFFAGETETGAALVARLTAYFTQAEADDWRRGASGAAVAPARGHVFLIGFPRSGTTLLGQVLAAHPSITTLDEQETLAEAAGVFMADAAGLDQLAALGESDLDSYRTAYWRGVADRADDLAGKTFVDKLPMNTLGLPLIAKLFPRAKVIFLCRDPRDVVLSCFRRQFVINGSNWEFLTLLGAARFYDHVMRLVDLYRAKLDIDLRIERYEDIVVDLAGTTRTLCDFLDLEWTDRFAQFGRSAAVGSIATPSAAQVARGLYPEGVGQWRRYQAELAPILPLLTPWVERFGYAA